MTEKSGPAVDLPKEQRRIVIAALCSAVVCGVTLWLAIRYLPAQIAFPTDLANRLAFTLRADIFVALWVMLAVRMVSKVRFFSAADSAGSAYTKPTLRLAVRSAFLQNSLEQAFIAIVAHLALAAVEHAAALAYIVGAVFLFSLGRFTFWLGYPYGAGGRAFGIVTTALPTLGAYGWVLFELFESVV